MRVSSSDGPRQGHLPEQPRGDAHVAAKVLEEGEHGDGALVVAQSRLECPGVDAERLRRARRRQDQQARQQRVPSPGEHLAGEPRCCQHLRRHATAGGHEREHHGAPSVYTYVRVPVCVMNKRSAKLQTQL